MRRRRAESCDVLQPPAVGVIMFKNEYQGGPCVEVFSAQAKEVKTSQWKLTGSGIKRIFDKEVKSSIFTLEGTTSATKMQLPKEVKQTLGLTQGILVLQIYVPQGHDLAVELGVLDSADQKCRLALSTAFKEMQVTALHIKIPLALIRRTTWLNLCIDLRSLVQDNLKSSSYKSLESICVSGNCKLRRIFTMRNQAPDTTDDDELYGIADTNGEVELETIPKQCQLAADVKQLTQVINFMKLQYYERKGKQPELPSTSRSGFVRDTDLSSGNVAADVSYHIAFGSKVPVPSRRAPLKEGNTTGRVAFVRQNSDVSAESSQMGQGDATLVGKDERFCSGTLLKRLKSETKTVELAIPADQNSDQSKTSHTFTGDIIGASGDGDDELSGVVKPHPPRKPSSEKPNRRRLRVKSTSSDPITAVNSSDGVVSRGSSESQKAGGIALKKNKQKNGGVSNSSSNPAEIVSDGYDTDSSDSVEYNELIKTLNKNKLQDGDKENLNKGHKVYVFSSRPTCIDTARTRTKHPRKQGMASAPSRKLHDPELRPNNIRRPVSEKTPRSSGAVTADASYDQDFQLSVISHLDRFEQSPEPRRSSTRDHRTDGRNGGDLRSSTKSQTRQSINRKSLREIPVEELQRSGGQKPYSFAKYQMGDVTESFEQQMLLSMQRADAASEAAVESDDEPSATHLPLGYEAMTDSSDDLSTHKSPKMLKNRSHNYQDEISNLGQNFMTQSNPRDWADVFSPPIVLPSSAGSRQPVNGQKSLHTNPCPTAEGITNREKRPEEEEEADTDEELDLLYDPELHYFYDPHTSKYYELITPGSNPKANVMLSRQ